MRVCTDRIFPSPAPSAFPSLVFVIFQEVDFTFSDLQNTDHILQFAHKDAEVFQVAYTYNILGTVSQLHLTQGNPQVPRFFFFCSPEMPENEATFAITAGGIGDAKE